MATNHLRHDIGAGRSGAPLKVMAAVLVLYTALYLAIVGVIHFISSPDASAAITPDMATARVEAAAAPVARFGTASGSPSARLPNPATGGTDNSRECTTAIDSECIYN
ncbi:MAG: hypothetical protein ABWY07_12310 [Burkholderiales bacterium]